jgi:flagellar P-ring protein precursor FlgI
MIPLSRALLITAAALLATLGVAPPAAAERIRDVTTVQGVRGNQLVGYGLVVGLDGTGDQTTQTPFTTQGIETMLGQLGLNLPKGTRLQLKNTAAVMVTTQLPPFAKPGQPLDVTVSSMGNAKSLRGGTLLLTPLKGSDGRVYAMAQGNVVIPGAGASAAGSSVQINQLNAGRIPAGATVERDVATQLAGDGILRFELTETDFAAASAVTTAINERFPGTAVSESARSVRVHVPQGVDVVAFVGVIEALPIELPQASAKVILNARTGSIVMNQAVALRESAVAHGNLTVSIATEPIVSQPQAFSYKGSTVVTERADVQVQQQPSALLQMPAGANLADVVKALNAIGATPMDLLSILQALKAAGSLRAELEII